MRSILSNIRRKCKHSFSHDENIQSQRNNAVLTRGQLAVIPWSDITRLWCTRSNWCVWLPRLAIKQVSAFITEVVHLSHFHELGDKHLLKAWNKNLGGFALSSSLAFGGCNSGLPLPVPNHHPPISTACDNSVGPWGVPVQLEQLKPQKHLWRARSYIHRTTHNALPHNKSTDQQEENTQQSRPASDQLNANSCLASSKLTSPWV